MRLWAEERFRLQVEAWEKRQAARNRAEAWEMRQAARNRAELEEIRKQSL